MDEVVSSRSRSSSFDSQYNDDTDDDDDVPIREVDLSKLSRSKNDLDKGCIIQDVNIISIIRRNAADAAAGSTTSFKYDPDLRMSKILVRMLRSLDTEKCNVSSPVPPQSQPAPNHQADSMNMNDASQ